MTLDSSDSSVINIREAVKSGIIRHNAFRLGGADAFTSVTSPSALDGATVLSTMLAYAEGSPLTSTYATRLAGAVEAGQKIQVGSVSYSVAKTGAEVQRLYLAADTVLANDTKFYRIFATHSGTTQYTPCLKFHSSAAEVGQALNDFDAFYEAIEVSRTGSGEHGDAYLYSIYFGTNANGANADTGDVLPLSLDYRECSNVFNSGVNATNLTGVVGVQTVVQGGKTEVQRVALALDTGYLESDCFRLQYDEGVTECLM